MGLLDRYGHVDRSHFNSRKHTSNRATTEEINTLPVLFIPEHIVRKLKALGYSVNDFVRMLPYNDITLYGLNKDSDSTIAKDEEDKRLLNEVDAKIGTLDMLSLYALNERMFKGGKHKTAYRLRINPLTENDIANEFEKISSQEPTQTDDANYKIVKNEECFIIIMNNNAYTLFEETYKQMSKELCEEMLKFIDDTFVYQSIFFKSL